MGRDIARALLLPLLIAEAGCGGAATIRADGAAISDGPDQPVEAGAPDAEGARDGDAAPPGSPVLLAAGGAHTCARGADLTVACWGRNTFGELGLPGAGVAIPTAVPGLPAVRALAAGGVGGSGTSGHTCVVAESGAVICWGANDFGQLGDGTRTGRYQPMAVGGIDRAVAVAAGRSHTCALRDDGVVWCWGRGDAGALGYGGLQDQLTPTPVAIAGAATQIALGFDHGCALLTDASVTCWGRNAYGEVGSGDRTTAPAPVAVAGLPAAASIGAGGTDSGAIAVDGSVWGWGDDEYGQLGDANGGAAPFSTTPTPIALQGQAINVDFGGAHGCALLIGGAITCWGSNAVGQLGRDGGALPGLVSGISPMTGLEIGASTSFAIDAKGEIWSWGDNQDGELGDGTFADRYEPVSAGDLP